MGFSGLTLLNLFLQWATRPAGDSRAWWDLGLVWLGITAASVAAVAALVAILRRGERAVLVFAALLPAALILAFEAGERIFP